MFYPVHRCIRLLQKSTCEPNTLYSSSFLFCKEGGTKQSATRETSVTLNTHTHRVLGHGNTLSCAQLKPAQFLFGTSPYNDTIGTFTSYTHAHISVTGILSRSSKCALFSTICNTEQLVNNCTIYCTATLARTLNSIHYHTAHTALGITVWLASYSVPITILTIVPPKQRSDWKYWVWGYCLVWSVSAASIHTCNTVCFPSYTGRRARSHVNIQHVLDIWECLVHLQGL